MLNFLDPKWQRLPRRVVGLVHNLENKNLSYYKPIRGVEEHQIRTNLEFLGEKSLSSSVTPSTTILMAGEASRPLSERATQ
jgi:hypothetical protein